MDIQFSNFILNPELLDTVSIEDRMYLNAIRNYIAGRLMPLKDMIDKEEKELDTRFIAVRLPNGLKFYDYSPSLVAKMEDSFNNSENDLIVLWDKLSDELKSLLN